MGGNAMNMGDGLFFMDLESYMANFSMTNVN
jgi:hypothetical protein